MHKNTTDPKFLSWFWLLVWAILIYFLVANLAGFYNFDAHKYISIALNMLHKQQYILPYFQGHPYADKGPLMFWLFILGWKIFGINLWWPQTLMYLFATATILLTILLAKLLWPQRPIIALLTPYILIAIPNWIGVTTEIRVDVLLMFFCIAGIVFLILAYSKHKFYWLLYALAITGGTLCKGPVILIFTFIPALFLPIINKSNKQSWYGFLVLFTLLGLLLTLIWAIPAAHLGGQQYKAAIFYHQISGRAMGHASYFYYLIRLPILLMPWILYVPSISGFKKTDFKNEHYAIKFCLFIIVLSLLIFSFYGQKRVHYLNPDVPIFALIISFAITNFFENTIKPNKKHQIFIILTLFALALFLLFSPLFLHYLDPRTHTQLSYLLNHKWIILLLLLAVALFFSLYPFKSYHTQIISIMLVSSILTTSLIIINMHVTQQKTLDWVIHINKLML